MENLEFVIELDRFASKLRAAENPVLQSDSTISHQDALVHQWNVIHRVFLQRDAIKEVNILSHHVGNLDPRVIPTTKELNTIRGVIYELLLDSYNEFVAATREQHGPLTATRRRRLELVPPEHPTAFTPQDQLPTINGRPLYLYMQSRMPSELREQWDNALREHEQSRVDLSSSSGDSDSPRSRTGSAGTLTSRNLSRGSSILSIVDNIKDYTGWSKTRRLWGRRASNELESNA